VKATAGTIQVERDSSPGAGDAVWGGDTALIARQALHSCHLSCAGDSLEPFEVRDELTADMRGLLEEAARG
jgi:hypothetical protein